MTSFPVSLLVCSGSFRVTVVAALALVGCLVSGAAVAQTATPQALLAALKQGGLVVFMRHGETGPAYADRKNAVMGDCATQRNLDAVGRAQNVEMALALKALKVPAGPVWSSEFCRSWQTAEALFGPKGYTITDKLSVPPSYPGVNAADSLANNTYLKAMLADKPPAGSNTWLISHGINILLATGYHPGEQGEIVLFRPDGEGTYGSLLVIHQRMDELGMSHVDLAQRLGTSRSYITRLLVGRANLSVQTLSRLAVAVGGVVRLQLDVTPTEAQQVS